MRELNGASMVFLCPPEPGDAPKRDNPGARDLAGDRQAHVDITLFSPTASPSARIG